MYLLSVYSQFIAEIYFCEGVETLIGLIKYHSRGGEFPAGVVISDPLKAKFVLKSDGRRDGEEVIFITSYVEGETVQVINNDYHKGRQFFKSSPAKITRL